MQYRTDYYWVCICPSIYFHRASISQCDRCHTFKAEGKEANVLELICHIAQEGIFAEDQTATLRLIKMIIDDTGVTGIT